MKLYIIAAVANNNVIGNENQLIWNMPRDLKHFKELTTGHTLIMGRKTFESIGKPLPKRRTIVVTRQKDFQAEGCKVVESIKDALCQVKKDGEAFIAGGGEIYRQVMNLHHTKKMYITRIFANFEGDAFFPEIDPEKWELTDREDHQSDEKNPYPFAFLTYKRKG
jgi:dihydrofolate reductase